MTFGKLYRKKPVVIEAVQWFKHGDHPYVRETSYAEISRLLGTSGCSKDPPFWNWQALGVIDTLEGPHVVIPGDWIIKGVAGEFYPCKAEIFEKTYEPVEDHFPNKIIFEHFVDLVEAQEFRRISGGYLLLGTDTYVVCDKERAKELLQLRNFSEEEIETCLASLVTRDFDETQKLNESE